MSVNILEEPSLTTLPVDNRDDQAVIDQVRSGQSLSITMIPDGAIPSNLPWHLESFQIPHVLVKDDTLWGFTGTNHLSIREMGSDNIVPTCFSYSINRSGAFLSSGRHTGILKLLPMNRYYYFHWHCSRDTRSVWSDAHPHNTQALWAAYQSGQHLICQFVDDEGYLNRHPINTCTWDISNQEPRLEHIRTDHTIYPEITRNETHWHNLKQDMSGQEIYDKANRLRSIVGIPQPFNNLYNCHYLLYPNQHYYNFYDLHRSTLKTYTSLTIFSCE